MFLQKDVFALCCRKKDDVGCQAESVLRSFGDIGNASVDN